MEENKRSSKIGGLKMFSFFFSRLAGSLSVIMKGLLNLKILPEQSEGRNVLFLKLSETKPKDKGVFPRYYREIERR